MAERYDMIKRKKSAAMQHDVELSNVDKIMYPKSGITKGDVLDYYEKIAPYFLAQNKDRPIVMQRFPDGIGSKVSFFQKQIPDYFPSWIDRKEVDLSKGEKQTLVMIDTKESLVFLANAGVLVFHAWLSSREAVHKPDKIVFDLDPSTRDLAILRRAARTIKKILEGYGLTPFVMTTGSRGYHVVTPIIPEHSFEEVHEFTKQIAQKLAHDYPDDFTVQMSKAKRKKRVFIDYLRNSYGQTSVAPYSLRAKEGAPVATPLHWRELATTEPQKYTLKNIFKRLARMDDPWNDFRKKAKRLKLAD